MSADIRVIIGKLQEQFAASMYEFRTEASLIVKQDQLVPACLVLRDEFDFVAALTEARQQTLKRNIPGKAVLKKNPPRAA